MDSAETRRASRVSSECLSVSVFLIRRTQAAIRQAAAAAASMMDNIFLGVFICLLYAKADRQCNRFFILFKTALFKKLRLHISGEGAYI